jgi:hypothetical protein
MSRSVRLLTSSLLVFLAFGASGNAQNAASTRFARGQSIQPVYEGWEKNPDGTYSMWFGYLNRNWEQRLTIPVGPDNNIQPGGPDRGQMTVFETAGKRRFAFAFKVVLPADWPMDRDLIWTLKANDTTLTAVGSLWSVWLVNEDVIATNRGSQRIYDPHSKNKPPTITQAVKGGSVAVGTPLTLTMGVTDDGLPRRRAAGELVPGGAGRGVAPPAGGGRGRGGAPLKVSWFQWRGPGVAQFDPEQAGVMDAQGRPSTTGGQATTKVTFDTPGTYVLRAFAEDLSVFTLPPDITVNVTAPGAVSQR